MATRRPVNRITPRKRPAANDGGSAPNGADATVQAPAADATVKASLTDATVEAPADATVKVPVDATVSTSVADATVKTPVADATAVSAAADATAVSAAADATAVSAAADATAKVLTADAVAEASTADATVKIAAAQSNSADEITSAQVVASSPRRGRSFAGALAGRRLIVVAAAAAVLTAFAVLAAFRPGVPGGGNRAYADPAATAEVTAAARNALQTVYSYDSKTVGGYKDAVHKVVTGKMRTDFDSFADTTVSAIQQAQSTATATADPIGVTMLTGDHAELLVNLVVSATKDGVPQETASGPIVLRMQKTNGHWLASEIADR
ncbi:hypothetical protein [Nocardia stercoris]|uniref:Mce-associated membrane protein n=1 Tax=Nocardia stercoris TaxID=2483361 RepID=A0A3M2KZL6_9NOCA|nr:hypothetical protein [Nocardia stercoris]RMI30927.1 hypothetical protein EBN03_20065 [Nocardia stercoris]